jgi:hypothetical protein
MKVLDFSRFARKIEHKRRSSTFLAAGRAASHMAGYVARVNEKETTMENPKLTSDRAELIINTLRDNPGVEMTLSDIADATGLPIEDLGAHLEDLSERAMLLKSTTVDGFDVYTFPAEYQRGTTGVDER